MTDLDQLDIMRRAITALGLGQCAPEELVAEARALESRREQDRGALSDAHARTKEMEAKIARNVAEAAARDMRIADLEATIEGTHKVFDGVGVAWSVGNDATRLPLVKRAALAVEPGAFGVSESRLRIADLERDLAAKDDARSDAIRMAHAAAEISSDLAAAEISAALDDAGAPKVYNLPDDTERPIPDPERIRLLGERVRGEHAERIREGDRAQVHRDRLAAADLALDDRDAPRFADGAPLSPAARIRAIPR